VDSVKYLTKRVTFISISILLLLIMSNENSNEKYNDQTNLNNNPQETQEIVSKEDIYEVVSKASKITKKITKQLDEGRLTEEDAKTMKDSVKQLSNSIKMVKDAILLQKTFEKNSPNAAQMKGLARMKYLFVIRHRKQFIRYILCDLQGKIPTAFTHLSIDDLTEKINSIFTPQPL